MSRRKESRNNGFFPVLILALLFIVGGVAMLVKDQVAVGINSRTTQFSAVGGFLLIFIGIIFLIVSYYSLSPNSKIREFFEGEIIIKKSKKRNK
jgi:hypothetical protein